MAETGPRAFPAFGEDFRRTGGTHLQVQQLLSIPGFEAAPSSFSYIDSKTGKGPVEPNPSGFAVDQPMPGFFLENIKTFVKYADGKEIRAADAFLKDPGKPYVFTSVANAEKDARAAGSTIDPIGRRRPYEFCCFKALVSNYGWHLRISPRDVADSTGLGTSRSFKRAAMLSFPTIMTSPDG